MNMEFDNSPTQEQITPLTIDYTDSGPADSVKYTLRFLVKIGGGAERHILMDTGSTGIVVPRLAIKNYSECEKVLPPLPAPHYSSSGAHYDGDWVYTSIELYDNQGHCFTIDKIPVFAVTEHEDNDVSSVSMMGIGIHSKVYGDEYNPFLNLPQMTQGQFQRGYIITSSQVIFGYSSQDITAFKQFSFAKGSDSAIATTTLTPTSGNDIQAFQQVTPLLLDTGIPYMIVTPKKEAKQPAREFIDPHTQHIIPGTQIDVTLCDNEGATFHYRFTASQAPMPVDPSYVRFAVPSAKGFVNTGRHILTDYDYLVDYDQKLIGLKEK
ncbi:hypothetical protein [uncultured Shewanella sp.]|uniref:hypothetical protein n=1 Tax=uncultured Shewanella sp. TaxID=173975 RepID=UPI00260D5E91|nr:hypothetical protein [uncultured Shewanella sp.]